MAMNKDAKDALNRFKMEAASEVEVQIHLKNTINLLFT
ncbi:MAG: small, acid-soluble spore protein, alpha/beta type [Clostridia bacterium]|nr:small, acid-soluble spore protein, alpha/beta type [Clostridia bacterium]